LLTKLCSNLVFRLMVKQLPKSSCCRLLKSRGYVAVDIKGYLYTGMSQSLLHNFRMYVLV